MKASKPEQSAWRKVLSQAEGAVPAEKWLRAAVEAVRAFGEERFCAESSAWLRELASGTHGKLSGEQTGELKAVLWYGTVSRCLEIQQAALGLLGAPGQPSAALAWTIAQFSPETAASAVVSLRRDLGLSDVPAIQQASDAFEAPPASKRLQ